MISERHDPWTEERLAAFEGAHAAGVTVQELVQAFGGRLSEATFRKYVQDNVFTPSNVVGVSFAPVPFKTDALAYSSASDSSGNPS